jgi:hypothetical protein
VGRPGSVNPHPVTFEFATVISGFFYFAVSISPHLNKIHPLFTRVKTEQSQSSHLSTNQVCIRITNWTTHILFALSIHQWRGGRRRTELVECGVRRTRNKSTLQLSPFRRYQRLLGAGKPDLDRCNEGLGPTKPRASISLVIWMMTFD